MPIQRRLIFPLAMFILAGASFAYGTWQWMTARAVQASADQRIAHVLDSVEGNTSWSDRQKQAFYIALFKDYPAGPTIFGIDLSGSFAAEPADQCVNDGQRTVSRSLYEAGADSKTLMSVCGACNPSTP